MVLGVRRSDGRLSVRVYMAHAGALTRIMAVSDAVISVELVGRDVIMRVPSAITGYEYRTVWSWDDQQHAMLPTQDEILRKPPEAESSGSTERGAQSCADRDVAVARRLRGATMRRRRLRTPAWTATLTWKAAVFITVMCCALAALLGVLVHTAVTRETVSEARDKALARLADATRAYEAGEALPPDSGIDPAGLPASCATWP